MTTQVLFFNVFFFFEKDLHLNASEDDINNDTNDQHSQIPVLDLRMN